MKLTGHYKSREVMGELLLIPCGDELRSFNGVRTLNGIGRAIYAMLEDGKDEDEIVDGVLELYDVQRDEAAADVRAFLTTLRDQHVLE